MHPSRNSQEIKVNIDCKGRLLRTFHQQKLLEPHSFLSALMKKITLRMIRDLVIAPLPALVFLGISHLATRKPWGVSTGFPLDYSHYNLGCSTLNSFNGCGYSYDPVLVGLDFLFWLAIAFALTLVLDAAKLYRAKARGPAGITG